ncbi:predicted protein [Arabidopsis lyrata subsp. lyrata]|uniref:Predicted protein n=1 Tax=Arabidopsis lyrata subsp. lyrata TaxID=81972 RepID=D7LK08_ARALL|nr:predicted protein [Arabidopsis lyrata subsp. lyrata]
METTSFLQHKSQISESKSVITNTKETRQFISIKATNRLNLFHQHIMRLIEKKKTKDGGNKASQLLLYEPEAAEHKTGHRRYRRCQAKARLAGKTNRLKFPLSKLLKRTKTVAAFNLEEDMRRHQIKTASNRDKKLKNIGTMQKLACLNHITLVSLSIIWNERFIVDNWDIPASKLIKRSGVVLTFEPEFEEVKCQVYGTSKPCQTRGCSHFLCDSCDKAYVDGGIKAGELNIKCPLMTCEKMIAPSQFVNLVSPDDKNNRRRGLLRSYARSRHVNRFATVYSRSFSTNSKGLFPIFGVTRG